MKKLKQQGFSHILILIVGALSVVLVAGYAGYRVYQSKQVDASAYTWTRVNTADNNYRTYACISKGATGRYTLRTFYLNNTSRTTTGLNVYYNNIGWVNISGSVAPQRSSSIVTRLGTSSSAPTQGSTTINSCN